MTVTDLHGKIIPIRGTSVTRTRDGQDDSGSAEYLYIPQKASDPIPDIHDLILAGLPPIGQAGAIPGTVVTGYDLTEDRSAGTLRIRQNCGQPTDEAGQTDDTPPATEEDPDPEQIISDATETARSWSTSEYAVDLVEDAVNGAPVILPTGEPFDSVPTVPRVGYRFSTTRKIKSFPADMMARSGTVNANDITIDGHLIKPHCGRLTAEASRIYGDPTWTWQLTLSVAIVSNEVTLSPGEQKTQIGHDIALLLRGYRYKDTSTPPKILRATVTNDEDGTVTPSDTPVLLTPDGKLSADNSPSFLRVATCPETAWRSEWFATPTPPKTKESP